MSTEEATVQIPSLPQPSSILWLGIGVAGSGLSWLVTLVTMLANEPTQGQMIAAGLCISVTASMLAVTAWMRYSLAKAAGEHQQQLSRVLAGQHALLVAESRGVRRSMEEDAARACGERQAIGVKVTRIIDEMPTYWHGVADTFQHELADDNVRVIGRPRPPH